MLPRKIGISGKSANLAALDLVAEKSSGVPIYEIATVFKIDLSALHRAIEQGLIRDRDGLIQRGRHYRIDPLKFECSIGRAWLGLERAILSLLEAGRSESDEAVYRTVSDFVERATGPDPVERRGALAAAR